MKLAASIAIVFGWLASGSQANDEKCSAYLMAYFGPAEKLFYAVSDDARHWQALNDGQPVFDAAQDVATVPELGQRVLA